MASAGSEESLDVDDGLLECAICMDKFVDPCVLPCSHTFCRQCLARHYESSTRSTAVQGVDENKVINCPSCRQTWPLPSGTCVDRPSPSAAAEYQSNGAGVNKSVCRPSCGSLVTADVSNILYFSPESSHFVLLTDLFVHVLYKNTNALEHWHRRNFESCHRWDPAYVFTKSGRNTTNFYN